MLQQLELTVEQAHNLIHILKLLFQKYRVNLSPGREGTLKLNDENKTEYVLNYFTSKNRTDKMSLINDSEREISNQFSDAFKEYDITPIGFMNKDLVKQTLSYAV